jgi:hypothetical protein
MFRTDCLSKNVPDRLFIEECSGQTVYRRMFRTDCLSKNVPDRLFIEECSGQTVYRRMFRTDCLSKNVPDRLFIGATNTANGKLHTKLAQLYFPRGLPLAVHRTPTKDSARATVTRTFLTCWHPKSCPQQRHQSNSFNSFQMLLAIGPQTSQGHVTDHTKHAVTGLQFKTVVYGMWNRVM